MPQAHAPVRFSRLALRASALAATALVFSGMASAQTIEVMHWWTSASESAAVKVLAETYGAAGGTWKDTAIAGTGVAQKAIIARLSSGNPPGASMFNFGKRIDEMASEGLLGDISDVAQRDKWAASVPAPILQAVTYKGKVVAVPVTVAGVNWVWFSPKVLKTAGVAAPKTMDEMFAAADKIKAAGFTPFAIGTQAWQLNWLYGNLLLGNGGRAVYEQFTKADPAVYATPSAAKAMEHLLRVRGLIDPAATNRSWNDSTNLVMTDRAAFQFMGDWAKGEFLSAGKKPGVDFGCMLTPGAQDLYVVMGDAFAMSGKVNAETAAAQKKLAAAVMDPRAQRRFALAKGSIPVRTDVPSVGFDECAVNAMKLMADPKAVVAGAPIVLSGDVNGAITDAIGKIWATPSIKPDAALQMLASAMKAAK